jgi:hypothetical protein
MKLSRFKLFQAMALATVITGSMLHGQAMAAGTLAGTPINNRATLNFSVDGTSQSPVNSSPTGNLDPGANGGISTTFVVDRRINLTVATTNALPVPVALGSKNMVTSFNVTNFTNDAIDVILTNINSQPIPSNGATTAATENFINTACTTHTTLVDAQANTNPVTRLLGVPASNLAPAVPTTVPVFLRCDIQPLTDFTAAPKNTYTYWSANKVNVVSLIGQAAPIGGTLAAYTEALGVADDPALVQNVFGDEAGGNNGTAGGAGSTNGGAGVGFDNYRDGKHSANSAYKISMPLLKVTKTEALICDPLNGASFPKRIPGALIKYTIVVSNDSTAAASGILNTVTDTLQNDLMHDATFIAGTDAASCVPGTGNTGFKLSNAAAASLVRPAGPFPLTNALDTDGAGISGQVITVNYANGLPAIAGSHAISEIKPGESVTIEYQAFIK